MNKVKIVGVVIVLWLMYTAFPLISVGIKMIRGTHLLVMMNDAERRPCGGFITALGEFSVLPPKLTIQNSYTYSDYVFGDAPFPVSNVASEMHIWDAGMSADKNVCAQDLFGMYEMIQPDSINGRVFLVNMSTVEQLFQHIPHLYIRKKKVMTRDFFAYTSRAVADIDRHNVDALDSRKDILPQMLKNFVKQTVARPHKWPRMTRFLRREINAGDLYISGISKSISADKNDLQVIEWNTGGAKSSRYLRWGFRYDAREILPNEWEISAMVSAQHIGGTDEPLSQLYKGFLEISPPLFLSKDPEFVPISIAPGEEFSEIFSWRYSGGLFELSMFIPPSMEMLSDISVSLYPQQTALSQDFEDVHENVLSSRKVLEYGRHEYQWESIADDVKPFVTLHEPILVDENVADVYKEYMPAGSIVEVHMSEKVRTNMGFSATLEDMNTLDNVTDILQLQDVKMLENQTTLLLFFDAPLTINEYYSLQISGIQDMHNNEINANQSWTIIQR